MNKIVGLICYYVGLWGILGFFATLIFGFIVCCLEISHRIFPFLLIGFGVIGIFASAICVIRRCKFDK